MRTHPVVIGAVLLIGWALADGARAAGAAANSAAYTSVDPFIGTGGEGHTFPGAVVPFGMIQLSPDTQIKPRNEAFGWAAGYRYEDHTIVGFSHTHFSGTGHSDLGDVLLMPIAGVVRLERGAADQPGSGYTSRFTHEGEIAQPGYYAVTLEDYNIRVELTASARVGVHRYRFSPRPERACAHRFTDTEQGVLYKGFAPPGDKDPRQRAQIEGRRLSSLPSTSPMPPEGS